MLTALKKICGQKILLVKKFNSYNVFLTDPKPLLSLEKFAALSQVKIFSAGKLLFSTVPMPNRGRLKKNLCNLKFPT